MLKVNGIPLAQYPRCFTNIHTVPCARVSPNKKAFIGSVVEFSRLHSSLSIQVVFFECVKCPKLGEIIHATVVN